MYLKNRNIKFFGPVRIIKFLYHLAKAPKRYYSPLSPNYYIFLISYLRCYLKGGFSADEVFQLGLGSSFPSDKNINKYVSYNKMTKIDRAVNPRSWAQIKHNKGIFYTSCKILDLPIPKLYAIIFKHHVGISYLNSSLVKRKDIIKLINEELHSEFVIKPELGVYGEFINIYTKTKHGIIDGLGNCITERKIYENIINNKKYDSFIVQERLRNSNDLLKIFPSDFLHTIRIITLIDSFGHCKILHAHLNVATAGNVASQLSELKIFISLNDGYLEYGILTDKNKGGFKKITEHPQMKLNFKELKMPLWKDVISLAEEAAFKFLPLRTLGWDIAITEKGLKILEANSPYSPPNFFQPMNEFIKILLNS